MAAFYSLLCKAIKKQPAGRSGRLFWRSGRDSNPRAIARKLISRGLKPQKSLISPHNSLYLTPQSPCKMGLFSYRVVVACFLFIKSFFTVGHHLGTTGFAAIRPKKSSHQFLFTRHNAKLVCADRA